MRCSKCGTDNPEGLKFCNECAAPFGRRCSKCGFENTPTAKFCGECAAPLNTPASRLDPSQASAQTVRITAEAGSQTIVAGERKTVTALFADIKGSTELMEELDPEEARRIIDPALKLMIEAVRRYDGYVVQSTGDGIFALFGAPVAHEDHPQRALYAALRLQDELKRYSAKVVADGSTPIQGRVGINTGEVVVRSIQTGAGQVEYTPIGHTTNLASRMQTAAPVGSMAVSEATRRLCEGYFILKPLGATRVKGVSEPVNIYEVTGIGPLRTRLQRAAGRGLTKFVGREREMEALKHAAEQAKSGHGQIVAVMAEPGVGKSRLFFEFKATSQSGWMVLETVSVSHGRASAYLPVLDLLHGYFKIAGEDDPRTRREKVTGRVLALDRSLEDALSYLFGLLGIVEGDDPLAQMDGQVKKRRTLEAIKRILLRESLNQPLLVMFEDLHWIDEQTQEFLNLLADSLGTAKILLMVNYRPEYSHQWNSKTYYTQLRLDPLGHENAEEMLAALLGDAVELRPLKRLVIEKTEGNPFFMEEIVQGLFEEGTLVRNGTIKVARSLSQLRIPPTAQAVLAARIDRLPAEQKELLQALAVIGREFPLSLVRAVIKQSDDELNRLLNDLQLGEFIYEQPAVRGTEYIFKHALTQEVAYNSLLSERRKLLHERAGQALESMFAGNLDDHLSELAHHYGRSDNIAKAVEYLGRAGQQALQRSSHADAIGLFSLALELPPALPETRERLQQESGLQLGLGAALTAVKGWAARETAKAFTRACELCRQLGDTPHLFQALAGVFVCHDVRREMKPALELARQLLSIARGAGDAAFLPAAHHAMAKPLYLMGQLIPARTNVELGLSFYDPAQYPSHAVPYFGPDVAVHSLTVMATCCWCLGFPDNAIQHDMRAVARARELAQPFSLCFALALSSFVHALRGEGQAASKAADAVFHLAAEQGFQQVSALAILLRGVAAVVSGHAEEGIARMTEVLHPFQRAARLNTGTWFLAFLAQAYGILGRVDDGFAALSEAMALVERTGVAIFEPELYRLKGELTLKRPEAGSNSESKEEAERYFLQAIQVAQRESAKSWELRATTSLARLLKSQGRRDEARAMLTQIYNWFTEGFDTADLKDAKALLDELS